MEGKFLSWIWRFYTDDLEYQGKGSEVKQLARPEGRPPVLDSLQEYEGIQPQAICPIFQAVAKLLRWST